MSDKSSSEKYAVGYGPNPKVVSTAWDSTACPLCAFNAKVLEAAERLGHCVSQAKDYWFGHDTVEIPKAEFDQWRELARIIQGKE